MPVILRSNQYQIKSNLFIIIVQVQEIEVEQLSAQLKVYKEDLTM